MYRLYILITDVVPTDFEGFISLMSLLYNSEDGDDGVELTATPYFDIYSAYMFELCADARQFKKIFGWFSERRVGRKDPIALVAVEMESDKMLHAINVSDVPPGMSYTWERFVKSMSKRLHLENTYE